MTNIYTIGTNGKTAEIFFNLLRQNNISLLIDTRANNTSQLAGFTKGGDSNLGFLLHEIGNIDYKHDLMLAPTKDLIKRYREKKINWNHYVKEFKTIITDRKMLDYLNSTYITKYKRICLLCSEEDYKECHRGIITEEFEKKYNIKGVHLI